jgi:5-oxopent-3-ene-1,2,5-tricarboxylate decarboxylase/2-hydroxyhepta-2,4-diene-1,7-dioate isomerase
MRTARVCVSGTAGVVTATVPASGEPLVVGGWTVPGARVRFEPACSGLVYGVVLNDAGALSALGDALNQPPYKAPPKAPVLYVKPYNTHLGHGASVVLPGGADRVHVFGALGIVFGAQATRVPEAQALEPVHGFTVVADLSLRQQSLYRPPIREKCFDGACPIGPWVVDRSTIGDPATLEVLVYVNGELRQRRALRNLIRPVPRLIADVTAFMTLYPGDVLLAGVPLEAPCARAGDSIAVEIPGIGRLENRIEAGS